MAQGKSSPGKLASAKSRISKLIRENKSLEKAKSAVKRAATKENQQLLAVGGLAAFGGGLAGNALQEKINSMDLPDVAKQVGPVPSGTIAGIAIALYSAFKLKGTAQAAGAGFGGGLAAGAYLQGGPV